MTDERATTGVQRGEPLAARPRGDRNRLELSRGTVDWDIDESAAVLAYMLPAGARRFGRKTIHRTLGDAARQNVTPRKALHQAEPDLIEYYRGELVKYNFFSQDDRDEADQRRAKAEQKARQHHTEELEQAERAALAREAAEREG